MKQTKDTLRVIRSTQRCVERCENLISCMLLQHRESLEELRDKYNLIEFV